MERPRGIGVEHVGNSQNQEATIFDYGCFLLLDNRLNRSIIKDS